MLEVPELHEGDEQQCQRRLAADHLAHRHAVDVLHGYERAASVGADVVEGDDVRMFQRGRGARFARESLPQLGVVARQHFDRQGPIEQRIARQIQRAHAALSDAIDDVVPANPVRHGCHGRPDASESRL